jgi:hypothetical protein
LSLLEEKVVELKIVEKASNNTIGRALKKHSQTASQTAMGDRARGQRRFRCQYGRCARRLSAAARSAAPVVCLDETSKQLIKEKRAPIPAKPGRKVRHAYEYERSGVANLFMMFAPLEGWRRDARRRSCWCRTISRRTRLLLYAAFRAAEERRLVEHFECHCTPKHGSCLDMAESELSVLATQCLDRRTPTR